jgi:tRNA (adenine57-N1/adenine58-N1)-methyltransferase
MIKKILLGKNGKKYYVSDIEKDMHTEYGYFKSADLKSSSGEIASNTGFKVRIFNPSFIDTYERIKRSAQIIPLKDMGAIIAYAGINKSSVIVDAGSGSGGLCCFLAQIAKKVTTYDIRDDHIAIVEENKKLFGLKNLTVKKGDIYQGVKEKNIDVLTLDVPEPWQAIETAKKILKVGCFIVSYSPSIPQTSDFVETIKKDREFTYLMTIEIIEREWEFIERRIRPMTQGIGHSGFLSFVRRV